MRIKIMRQFSLRCIRGTQSLNAFRLRACPCGERQIFPFEPFILFIPDNQHKRHYIGKQQYSRKIKQESAVNFALIISVLQSTGHYNRNQ